MSDFVTVSRKSNKRTGSDKAINLFDKIFSEADVAGPENHWSIKFSIQFKKQEKFNIANEFAKTGYMIEWTHDGAEIVYDPREDKETKEEALRRFKSRMVDGTFIFRTTPSSSEFITAEMGKNGTEVSFDGQIVTAVTTGDVIAEVDETWDASKRSMFWIFDTRGESPEEIVKHVNRYNICAKASSDRKSVHGVSRKFPLYAGPLETMRTSRVDLKNTSKYDLQKYAESTMQEMQTANSATLLPIHMIGDVLRIGHRYNRRDYIDACENYRVRFANMFFKNK